MSKQLKVDIREYIDRPGYVGTTRDIRIMVFDPDNAISHPYDKATSIADIENKAAQLQQYQALITALKEANKVLRGYPLLVLIAPEKTIMKGTDNGKRNKTSTGELATPKKG